MQSVKAVGYAVGVALVAAACGACFSPQFDSCAVTCGSDGECPPGAYCLGDRMCHARIDEALCSISGGDGGIDLADARPDEGDGGIDRIDAADPDIDAADPDIDANGPPQEPMTVGDVVVSEILKNPEQAQDPLGEWFELYNPTSIPWQLQGLRVADDGGDLFEIENSVILVPGGRVVLAREGNPGTNGGVDEDYAYGETFSLGNNDDEVEIINVVQGVTLDRVAYQVGGWPSPSGASLSLDPDSHDSNSNNDGGNWCDAVNPFGDGDLGTPGQPNPECP